MTFHVTTVSDLQQAVREHAHLRVRGGGTKSSPPDGIGLVDLAGISGITEYSPAECVFTAGAGTPVLEITSSLAVHGQYLPFDPPFAPAGATIGGTVASGVSGPRRYRYGGVRDFLIGVGVVDGEGRLIRSGGKVVKNAAGFLLHHGMVGSLGRFGVLTEVTFKVFPQPKARRTISVECEGVAGAFATARQVESLRCDCESIDFDERGHLWIGLAGSAAVIDARAARPVPASSCVKVAGLMNSWPKLRDHVTLARFMCAGAVAWLCTDRLAGLAAALRQAQLTGLVIRGPQAGHRIGYLAHNEFEERLRRVLDPQDKFSAAPDSRR